MKITKTKLKQLIKKTILESRWDYDPDEYYGEKRRNKELYGGSGEIVTGLDAANARIRQAAAEKDKIEAKVGLGDTIDKLVKLLEGADRQTLNDYLLEIEAIEDKDSPAFKIADTIYDVILDLGESAGYVDK